MESLERKLLIFGAWCGAATVILMFSGLAIIAGYFPPHPPSDGAEKIADFYRSNFYSIRIGLIIMMLSSATMIGFASATSVVISKVEKKHGFLSNAYLISGFGLALLIFYPAIWWLTGAYRPDRDIELIYLLNDAGWLQFVGGLFIGWPMFGLLAAAAFVESGPEPYFSRWYGYLNAWVAVAFLPGQIIFFVYSGPFAWNGLISFYVAVSAFAIWAGPTVYYIWKAGKRT